MKNLDYTSAIIVALLAGFILGRTWERNTTFNKFLETNYHIDTFLLQDTLELHRIDVDTVYIYKDTADSHFFKTILQIESGLITEMQTGDPDQYEKVIGDGGRAHGNLGIHAICIKNTPCHVLGYTHEDMFDLEKASHVFWAKMGVYCYKYKKEFGKLPSYETLGRMWNGSYKRHNSPSTIKYRDKYRKWTNRNLSLE
jgi:hypothetical protein